MSDPNNALSFNKIINACLFNVITAKVTKIMMEMIENDNGIMGSVSDIKSSVKGLIFGIIGFIKNILGDMYKYHPLIMSCIVPAIAVVFIIVIVMSIRLMIKTCSNKRTINKKQKDTEDSEEDESCENINEDSEKSNDN